MFLSKEAKFLRFAPLGVDGSGEVLNIGGERYSLIVIDVIFIMFAAFSRPCVETGQKKGEHARSFP